MGHNEMEPLDLSPRQGRYRNDLYYWLAALNYAAYYPDGWRHDGVIGCLPGATFGTAGQRTYTWPMEHIFDFWEDRRVFSTYGQIGAITAGDFVIVFVRGTQDWVQLLNQLAFVFLMWDMTEDRGDVHVVFYNFGAALYALIAPKLAQVMPGRRVIFTGHSLGGAMAQIMAHWAHEEFPGQVAGVVTFGCPRVGNDEFSRAHSWPLHRVEVQSDIVTMLPPEARYRNVFSPWDLLISFLAGYRHGGEEWVLRDDGTIISYQEERTTVASNWPGSPLTPDQRGNWINRHMAQNYILYTRRQFPNDIREAPRVAIDLVELDRICETLVTENEGWTWPFASQANYRRPPAEPPNSGGSFSAQADLHSRNKMAGIGSSRGTPGRSPRRGPLRY